MSDERTIAEQREAIEYLRITVGERWAAGYKHGICHGMVVGMVVIPIVILGVLLVVRP